MSEGAPGTRAASPTIWLVRALLLAAIVACAYLGYQHWQREPSLLRCLDRPRPCIGVTIEGTRMLRAIRRQGGGWRLDVEGREVNTDSALPGVIPGDLVEAALTMAGPKRVIIHRHVVLRPWRLKIRIGSSLAVSALLGALVLRRLRRQGREA